MRIMLLLIEACSAWSSGVLMAHSSSRPSRAPAVVATVSGASVLIVVIVMQRVRTTTQSATSSLQ